MQQPFERMPTVLTAEELIDHAFKEIEREVLELPAQLPPVVKAKRRETDRVKTAEKVMAGYIEGMVKSVPTIDNLHPFYRDLLEILVGIAAAKAALGRLSRTARIIHEAAKIALRQLTRPRNSAAAGTARRAFMGRAASLIREVEGDFTIIAELREKMKDLPTADPNLPTIVLAGYPGVGKSTIVGQVSSAKPQVRSYPFTTKEIIVGHVKQGHLTLQLVDTPGILDKPLEKRGKVEMLAVTALGHLSNIIAFIVDVSEANAYSLEDQKGLMDNIMRTFPGIRLMIFFNKTDAASTQQLEEAEALFGPSLRISATRGEGLDAMLESINRELVDSSRQPKAALP
jgi:nucleolar GTP-binding protein